MGLFRGERFNGWQGAYVGTDFGWWDRQLSHFRTYAGLQRKEPDASTPHASDEFKYFTAGVGFRTIFARLWVIRINLQHNNGRTDLAPGVGYWPFHLAFGALVLSARP